MLVQQFIWSDDEKNHCLWQESNLGHLWPTRLPLQWVLRFLPWDKVAGA